MKGDTGVTPDSISVRTMTGTTVCGPRARAPRFRDTFREIRPPANSSCSFRAFGERARRVPSEHPIRPGAFETAGSADRWDSREMAGVLGTLYSSAVDKIDVLAVKAVRDPVLNGDPLKKKQKKNTQVFFILQGPGAAWTGPPIRPRTLARSCLEIRLRSDVLRSFRKLPPCGSQR